MTMKKLHGWSGMEAVITTIFLSIWGVYSSVHIIPELGTTVLSTGNIVSGAVAFMGTLLTINKTVRKVLIKWDMMYTVVSSVIGIVAMLFILIDGIMIYYSLTVILQICTRIIYATIWEDKLQIIFQKDERFVRNRIRKSLVLITSSLSGGWVIIFNPSLDTVLLICIILLCVESVVDIINLFYTNQYIQINNLKYGFEE